MTHTETPGRSGISAQFLSLPLGGNFPGAAVPGLSAQPFGHAQELRCSPTKTVQAILKTQLRWGSGGCAES